MTATRERQARMLAQLQEIRLASARRALAEAQRATRAAEAQACIAEVEAQCADRRLAGHRSTLAERPADPPTQLALVDRALFQQAVARSAVNDAAEAERLCREAEQQERSATMRAQARHDHMAGQAQALARRAARQREARAQLEAEDKGGRSWHR